MDRALAIEIDGGVTGRILQGLEVCANRRKELAANLII
jgi:hypothetical protein